MIPMWGHGLFVKSLSFYDPDAISNVLDGYKQDGMAL